MYTVLRERELNITTEPEAKADGKSLPEGPGEEGRRLKKADDKSAKSAQSLRGVSMADQNQRNERKVRRGVVVSDKMEKTIVVEIEHRSAHPSMARSSAPPARSRRWDSNNKAHVGDTVGIAQDNPLSKTKRWRLVSIIERAK